MEEYIELINSVSDILNKAEMIKDNNERQSFLEKNIDTFNNFKNSLNIILKEFQFKQEDNKMQNAMADKVKNNIVRLLNINNIFEKDEQYPYFKCELIESLSWNENNFVFKLQNEADMSKVESALRYLQDRQDYIEVLKANNLFEGQDLNDSAAKQYVSNEYEQNLFGHALMTLKKIFYHYLKMKLSNY